MENALVCVNNNGILNTVADIFKFPKPGTNLFNIVMNYCTIEHLSCLTALGNSGVLGWNFKHSPFPSQSSIVNISLIVIYPSV